MYAIFFAKNHTERHFPDVGPCDAYLKVPIGDKDLVREIAHDRFGAAWSHIDEYARIDRRCDGHDLGVLVGLSKERSNGRG
jgi:hypothetical protein